MLSILVPIFNFDVVSFVRELHRQCTEANIDFELLCYDDASNDAFKKINAPIANLSNTVYLELPENYGRSKIRNHLAEAAQYDYLLFVDCDSEVVSDRYIQNYLDQLNPSDVLYGGRTYQANPPVDGTKHLRWLYGVERETIGCEQRKKTPYRSFLTNNYLIPRNIQLATKLNEQLKGYGHEDTLLGFDLKSKGVPIRHVANPLCHIGLESSDEFMNKTRQGLKNLSFIIESGFADEDIKIYGYYRRLKKLGLTGLFGWYYQLRKAAIKKNLSSTAPKLTNFDLLKLGTLIEIAEK